MLKIYLLVIGFSYVAVCSLFSSLFFLFRIVRIRRRRKVHVRYISSVMRFLLVSRSLYVVVRPSVSLSLCRLSSVTLMHPTQAIEVFGNVSTPFGTLAICDLSINILRRSSQRNPSVEGLHWRWVAKYSDSGPFQGYISETVQGRR